MTKKEVATTTEALPAHLAGNDTARGQENVTVDDLSIPRLDVIQALSPQRKKTAPEYIEGAEEGMLYNSVTNVLYGTEVVFVPVFFRKEFLLWRDREQGGGFGGAYKNLQEAKAEMAERGHGWDVVETAQHFGLIVGNEIEEVVISMSRSKMKASRQLNTLAKLAGNDRFASKYSVSAVEVSGDQGDYFNLNIKRLGWVEEKVYKMGEALYNAVSAGERDVNREEAGEATEEEGDY